MRRHKPCMSGIAFSTCCMKAGRPMRAADRAGWHRSSRHSAEAAHTRSGSCCAAVQTSNRASAVRMHRLTPLVCHSAEARDFNIASSHMLPVRAAAQDVAIGDAQPIQIGSESYQKGNIMRHAETAALLTCSAWLRETVCPQVSPCAQILQSLHSVMLHVTESLSGSLMNHGVTIIIIRLPRTWMLPAQL